MPAAVVACIPRPLSIGGGDGVNDERVDIGDHGSGAGAVKDDEEGAVDPKIWEFLTPDLCCSVVVIQFETRVRVSMRSLGTVGEWSGSDMV